MLILKCYLTKSVQVGIVWVGLIDWRFNMYLKNLLKETKQVLSRNGLAISDVEWFGTDDCEFTCDLEDFLDINCDDGYGSVEVGADFVVVGSDFWLERNEYDGSEWWEFKRMPVKPSNKKTVSKLIDYR